MDNFWHTEPVLTGHSGMPNIEVPKYSADRLLCPVSDWILEPLFISTSNTRSTF